MDGAFDPVGFLRARTEPRFVVGIAGPPGAGKTTFAAWLVSQLGPSSIVLPMDGFHLSNAELDARGIRDRKGAPDTYDVEEFLNVLRALRTGGVVSPPAYSRITHEPEYGAICILSSHRVVIVEGNYLLVQDLAWKDVKGELDEVWYLDVSVKDAAARLRGRHMAVGRSIEEAARKTQTVDLPNGEIVAATRCRADRVISDSSPRMGNP